MVFALVVMDVAGCSCGALCCRVRARYNTLQQKVLADSPLLRSAGVVIHLSSTTSASIALF